jgi:hypothetical protein
MIFSFASSSRKRDCNALFLTCTGAALEVEK